MLAQQVLAHHDQSSPLLSQDQRLRLLLCRQARCILDKKKLNKDYALRYNNQAHIVPANHRVMVTQVNIFALSLNFNFATIIYRANVLLEKIVNTSTSRTRKLSDNKGTSCLQLVSHRPAQLSIPDIIPVNAVQTTNTPTVLIILDHHFRVADFNAIPVFLDRIIHHLDLDTATYAIHRDETLWIDTHLDKTITPIVATRQLRGLGLQMNDIMTNFDIRLLVLILNLALHSPSADPGQMNTVVLRRQRATRASVKNILNNALLELRDILTTTVHFFSMLTLTLLTHSNRCHFDQRHQLVER